MQRHDLKTFFPKLTLVDTSSLSIRTYSRPIFASAAATSFYHLPIEREKEREREYATLSE